jgi:hypothetical protein
MKRLLAVTASLPLALVAFTQQGSRTRQLAPGLWYWQGNREVWISLVKVFKYRTKIYATPMGMSLRTYRNC